MLNQLSNRCVCPCNVSSACKDDKRQTKTSQIIHAGRVHACIDSHCASDLYNESFILSESAIRTFVSFFFHFLSFFLSLCIELYMVSSLILFLSYIYSSIYLYIYLCLYRHLSFFLSFYLFLYINLSLFCSLVSLSSFQHSVETCSLQ